MNKDNNTIEEAMQEVENAFKELAFPDPMRGAAASIINQEPRGESKGLTKLEYFAAKAMEGVFSNPELFLNTDDSKLAKLSFDIAESMIKESIKRQSK